MIDLDQNFSIIDTIAGCHFSLLRRKIPFLQALEMKSQLIFIKV